MLGVAAEEFHKSHNIGFIVFEEFLKSVIEVRPIDRHNIKTHEKG